MPGKPQKRMPARQTALNTIIQKIDQLRNDMEAGFMQTNEQLRGEIQTRVEPLRGEVQAGFVQVNARISSVEKSLADFEKYTKSELGTMTGMLREVGEMSYDRIDAKAKEWQVTLLEAKA